MMNVLNLHRHGDVRMRHFKVGSGHVYSRREKFCVRHGWIDMFLAGGDKAWTAEHAACEHRNENPLSFRQETGETPRPLNEAA